MHKSQILCYNKTMITKEVNEWVKKVESGMYKEEDLISEFSGFAKYLTKEELESLQQKLTEFYNK